MVIIFSLELWDELQMTQELNVLYTNQKSFFIHKFLDDLAIFCPAGPDNWFIQDYIVINICDTKLHLSCN